MIAQNDPESSPHKEPTLYSLLENDKNENRVVQLPDEYDLMSKVSGVFSNDGASTFIENLLIEKPKKLPKRSRRKQRSSSTPKVKKLPSQESWGWGSLDNLNPNPRGRRNSFSETRFMKKKASQETSPVRKNVKSSHSRNPPDNISSMGDKESSSYNGFDVVLSSSIPRNSYAVSRRNRSARRVYSEGRSPTPRKRFSEMRPQSNSPARNRSGSQTRRNKSSPSPAKCTTSIRSPSSRRRSISDRRRASLSPCSDAIGNPRGDGAANRSEARRKSSLSPLRSRNSRSSAWRRRSTTDRKRTSMSPANRSTGDSPRRSSSARQQPSNLQIMGPMNPVSRRKRHQTSSSSRNLEITDNRTVVQSRSVSPSITRRRTFDTNESSALTKGSRDLRRYSDPTPKSRAVLRGQSITYGRNGNIGLPRNPSLSVRSNKSRSKSFSLSTRSHRTFDSGKIKSQTSPQRRKHSSKRIDSSDPNLRILRKIAMVFSGDRSRCSEHHTK